MHKHLFPAGHHANIYVHSHRHMHASCAPPSQLINSLTIHFESCTCIGHSSFKVGAVKNAIQALSCSPSIHGSGFCLSNRIAIEMPVSLPFTSTTCERKILTYKHICWKRRRRKGGEREEKGGVGEGRVRNNNRRKGWRGEERGSGNNRVYSFIQNALHVFHEAQYLTWANRYTGQKQSINWN